MAGALFILLVVFLAVIAPWVTPYDYATLNTANGRAKPLTRYTVDEAGWPNATGLARRCSRGALCSWLAPMGWGAISGAGRCTAPGCPWPSPLWLRP